MIDATELKVRTKTQIGLTPTNSKLTNWLCPTIKHSQPLFPAFLNAFHCPIIANTEKTIATITLNYGITISFC